MDTTSLRFFHGTSAQAAAAILAEGARDPFSRLQAREFVREIWPVILEAAGSLGKTANLFDQAGGKYSEGAPYALQKVYDDNNASTFSYGAFYVSFSLKKAARYALRNRSGSELLLFIEAAIKVIQMLDPGLLNRLSGSYSGLMRQLEQPAHPVVLEVSGIEASRLLGEGGGEPNLGAVELAIKLQGETYIEIGPSFRVVNLMNSDITAVYDLKKLADANKNALLADVFDSYRLPPSQWVFKRG
jgi:hypothetical protein